VKKTGHIALIFLVTVGLATLARSVPTSAQNNPCRDELQKFCQGVTGGRQEKMQCLNEHLAELSSACKERLQTASTRARGVQGACSEDIPKFCKDAQASGGGLRECLKEHQPELSLACSSALAGGDKPQEKQ